MEESNWYYNDSGKPTGPMNLTDLRQLFTNGTLHAGTLVWHQTLVQWIPAGQVPGLLPPIPPLPPLAPITYHSSPPSTANHSGMAIAAFVFSLIGLVPCIGIFLAIPGLILALVALSGMSNSNNREGHGLAVAALVIGIIGCLCHCGFGTHFLFFPPHNWHYEFHRAYHWNGWNT